MLQVPTSSCGGGGGGDDVSNTVFAVERIPLAGGDVEGLNPNTIVASQIEYALTPVNDVGNPQSYTYEYENDTGSDILVTVRVQTVGLRFDADTTNNNIAINRETILDNGLGAAAGDGSDVTTAVLGSDPNVDVDVPSTSPEVAVLIPAGDTQTFVVRDVIVATWDEVDPILLSPLGGEALIVISGIKV